MIGDLLLGIGGKLIDRLWPDPVERDKQKVRMLELAQAGEFKELEAELELLKGQIQINAIEAQSNSFWKSGWRPFVGWVCGTGFATQFVFGPLLTWISAMAGYTVEFPQLDMGTLMTCLFGLLGLGGMRTYEKTFGAGNGTSK